jgi:sulfoxide reductase heme-binding subunit YedZ
MSAAKAIRRTPIQVAKRAKLIVLPLSMVPLVIALLRYLADQWGGNAIEAFTLDTGNWGIRLLLVTLAITPVRELTRWNWLITYRRPMGLAAFYYLCVHFLVYLYLDFAFDLPFILSDLSTSLYVVVGFVGFLLLVPLAVTSTNGWIRALGKRWRFLHRLVYAAVILGVVHYLLQIKEISFQLWFYIIAGGLLLGYRVVAPMLKRSGGRR